MDGAPATGSSLTSATPVSWKPSPDGCCGLCPVLTNSTTGVFAVTLGKQIAVVAPHWQDRQQRLQHHVGGDALAQHGAEDVHILDRDARDRGQVEVAPRVSTALGN